MTTAGQDRVRRDTARAIVLDQEGRVLLLSVLDKLGVHQDSFGDSTTHLEV